MAKSHRGEPKRDALAMATQDGVALVLILEAEDAQLIERLLTFYATEAYIGSGPRSHQWRGYRMRHDEARALALKVKNLWRSRRG